MKKKAAFILTAALSAALAAPYCAETLTEGMTFENAESKLIYDGFVVETDYEGNSIVGLLFDYTNNREDASCAALDYYLEVYQNGVSLDMGFPSGQSAIFEDYGNGGKNIKDGASLPICFCYELQDASELELTIQDMTSFEKIGEDLTVDLSQTADHTETSPEADTERPETNAGDSESEIAELEAKITEQNQLIQALQQELEDAQARIAELEAGKEEIPQTEAIMSEASTQDTAAAVTGEATIGEKNALAKAESYLEMTAFSYSSLIEQLEYEGFSTDEATYAADRCGADWKEQAAVQAQSYLDMTSFSRDGLLEQLEYEGFTSEQAEYGVAAAGY
ncbi:MAG: Ltp family lipoprotein [Lachnospiraceae bacterium]|nr:Ltp family lipoprotein [Lachnospiraceae bacterium]